MFTEFGNWLVIDSFSKNGFRKLFVCGGAVRNFKKAVLQWREEINWQGRSGGNDRLFRRNVKSRNGY